jgi:class 3 adenylate cyclase
MLRIKALHDTVQEQARSLERQAGELAAFNQTLQERVGQQVTELERMGRLKRFFSPHLAELIVAGGAEDPLKSHRREVTVVFLDLRGFTPSPDRGARRADGGLRSFTPAYKRSRAGARSSAQDGMIFFNDPVPVPNPAKRALMVIAMRERVSDLAGMAQAGDDLAWALGPPRVRDDGATASRALGLAAPSGRSPTWPRGFAGEAKAGSFVTSRVASPETSS